MAFLAAGGVGGLLLSQAGGSAHGPITDVLASTELPLSVTEESVVGVVRLSIVGKSRTPITITRIVANDSENIYGCDLREGMNGKMNMTNPSRPSNEDPSRKYAEFTPVTLKEGGEDIEMLLHPEQCGDQIVKICVETDQGSQDYEFGR